MLNREQEKHSNNDFVAHLLLGIMHNKSFSPIFLLTETSPLQIISLIILLLPSQTRQLFVVLFSFILWGIFKVLGHYEFQIVP